MIDEVIFTAARTLVGATHLIASALAATGPMVVAALRLPGRRPDADTALKRGLAWSLVAMGVGLATGGLSAWLVSVSPASGYAAAWSRLPGTAVAMLATEWLITAALYACYWFTWDRWENRRRLHAAVAWFAGTNLLYHFATMMVVLGAVAAEPQLASGSPISRPVFRNLITQPLALSLALHYTAYCTLVGGVAIGLALATVGAGAKPAAIALAGLTVSLVTGGAVLVNEPAGVQRAMLGGSLLATMPLLLSLTLALRLGWLLLAALVADVRGAKPTFREAAWLLFAITLGMVWSGHVVSKL